MTQLARRQLSWQDKLSAARLFSLRRWPWMRVAMFGLIPREMPGLGTLGVTHDGILMVDPTVIEGWTIEQTAAVLVHELSHVIRDHALRAKALGVVSTLTEANTAITEGDMFLKKLWNWAGDAEINDDLIEADWDLPGNPITPAIVSKLTGQKLEEGLLAEEYFAAMRKAAQEQQEGDEDEGESGGDGQDGDGSSGGGGDEEGDEDGDGDGDQDGEGQGKSQSKGKGKGKSKSKDKPSAGEGWCGGCAGRELPGEAAARKDVGGGRSKAEMKGMRRATAEAIQNESQKGRGTIPGGWERWADQELEPVKINWRTKLQRTTRNFIARRPGAVDMAYHKPSRRQAGVGYGNGKPVMPAYFAPVPRAAIFADTSGSMGQSELLTVASHGDAILKAIGADVLFAAIDAEMQCVAQVRDVKQLCAMLKGGGGTDFRPAFEWVMKIPKHKRPELLIFCTDGQGPGPVNPPPGIFVIWLLVGAHKELPHAGEYGSGKRITWHEIIEIDDVNERDAEAA